MTPETPYTDLDPGTLRSLAIEAETALLRLPCGCADAAEIEATLDALEGALAAGDFLAA